tara:strand:- start:278 stop:862 length:585 start_codon:yes stop_codon:yes gene_type:complete
MVNICQCGYLRQSLPEDSLCPECGELPIDPANCSLKEHWKYSNQISRLTFLIATIATLLTGLSSLYSFSVLFNVPSDDLVHYEFIFYALFWMLFSFPIAFVTIIFALTQCFKTFNKIARISVWASVVSGIYPSLMVFIYIWSENNGFKNVPNEIIFFPLGISLFFMINGLIAYSLIVKDKKHIYSNLYKTILGA